MTAERLAQALALIETRRGQAARRRARWRGTVRVLVTGAHPDDEMSAMLAALTWRDGVHVVYACATRGEGGQNAIGGEAGPVLGALRSREMEEAARRLGIGLVWLSDAPGASPMDFGFARSPEATFARWGRAHVVARLVDTIRRVAPDIVWTCFRDVDGQHGHHRAVARATIEAVGLAGDAAYAPAGIASAPWTVAKLYSPAWSGSGASYDDALPPPPPSVVYDASGCDPVTGLAYVQIGEVSRAAHASQGMGVWRDAGAPCLYPLQRIDAPVGEADLFDGIARDFAALAALTSGGAAAALRAADRVLSDLAATDAELPDPAALRAARGHLDQARLDLASDAPATLRHRIDLRHAGLLAALAGDLDADAPARAARPSVPALSLRVEPEALPLPTGPEGTSQASRIAVDLVLSAGEDAPARDAVDVGPLLPAGWSLASPVPRIALAPGENCRIALALDMPAGPATGEAAAASVAFQAEGAPAQRVEAFAYPHVGDVVFAAPAVLRVRRVALATPPGVRIAHCGDGPDRTDTVLRRLGADTTSLTAQALDDGDLARFDTLILGIGVLRRLTRRETILPRLHGWVRAGGHLVTLHHKPADGWDPSRSAPGFLEIGTPSIRWRACDPAAPVRILAPDHPLLNWPNAIVAADWDGWRHERCVHAPMRWNPAYLPIVATADAGAPEIPGAMLSGSFGAGRHTHVALALHRQYPELVPGALRLLANLVQPARTRPRG